MLITDGFIIEIQVVIGIQKPMCHNLMTHKRYLIVNLLDTMLLLELE